MRVKKNLRTRERDENVDIVRECMPLAMCKKKTFINLCFGRTMKFSTAKLEAEKRRREAFSASGELQDTPPKRL